MNYKKVYDNLIRRARVRRPLSRECYERHHVLPRCIGGRDTQVNLVYLMPEEHYVAHQLLVRMHPGNSKLLWAALAMTGTGRGNGRVHNKLYGWLRRRFVAQQTGKPRWDDATKRRIGRASKQRNQGENHPMFGREHSEKTKALIRASRVGKPGPNKKGEPFSPEHCRSVSKGRRRFFEAGGQPSFLGCSHSEDARQKMRDAKHLRKEFFLSNGIATGKGGHALDPADQLRWKQHLELREVV